MEFFMFIAFLVILCKPWIEINNYFGRNEQSQE